MTQTQQQTIRLEEQINQLDAYTSNGTTLISYYAPPDTNLQDCIRKVQTEQNQAQNIKSKQTRKNVQKALRLLNTKLQSLSEIPENGVAIFTGKQKQTDEVSILIEPPLEINTSIYICQDSFNTEPLHKQTTNGETYGVLLFDSNNATIATVKGANITVHETLTSLVPGKHTKGGQSQQRFERRRTEKLHNFYKKIGKSATKFIPTNPNEMNGLLIGGPQHTRKQFIRNDYLHHQHQTNILYKDSVSIINKNGIRELLDKGQDQLKSAQITRENNLIEQFLTQLREDTSVYGKQETLKAAEYGAIDTLLLSKQVIHNPDLDISDIQQIVEQYNGTIEILDCSSEKGKQFQTVFNGIGATLRYPIN